MITNDKHHLDYRVRLDENTVLYINRKRQDGKLICQANFSSGGDGKLGNFYTANEIFEHYHIHNPDLQDAILRAVDFIDGKL